MSISRLGKSKDLEKFWSKDLGGQPETRVEILSLKRKNVTPCPGIEKYPYKGQILLKGTITFDIPARDEETFSRKGQYQYRTASGLFLLDSHTDLVDPEKVFSDLNSQLSTTAEIQEAISPSRDSLWQFIQAADSVSTLRLRNESGTIDATLLIELLRHDKPIVELQSNPQFSELKSYPNIEEIIRGTEGEVNGIQDLDIDIYHTIIDEVEASYWFMGNAADFHYRRGVLTISADEEDAKECLIQLFEKYMLE